MKIRKTAAFIGLALLVAACDSPDVVQTQNSGSAAAAKTEVVAKQDSAEKLIKSEAKSSKNTQTSNDKHPLWKIKGKNGNTMYLVGSVHLMKPDVYPLDDVFQDAFADAESLVFEIDEEIQDPYAAQQAVSTYATVNGGGLLKNKIAADDYAEIRALAKDKKVPMLMIDPFDPWYSSMTLAVMQYMNAGLSPEFGIDQHFMARAQEAKKPILGLETIDEQFGILDSMSYDVQIEMLKETLKDSADIMKLIDAIDENWREGDMDELYEILMEDFAESPEFYNKLLKQRNEKWIPQLLPMLEEADDYMVVVGAAHMLGEDGVLTLLEKEGYSAEQL